MKVYSFLSNFTQSTIERHLYATGLQRHVPVVVATPANEEAFKNLVGNLPRTSRDIVLYAPQTPVEAAHIQLWVGREAENTPTVLKVLTVPRDWRPMFTAPFGCHSPSGLMALPKDSLGGLHDKLGSLVAWGARALYKSNMQSVCFSTLKNYECFTKEPGGTQYIKVSRVLAVKNNFTQTEPPSEEHVAPSTPVYLVKDV